MPNKKRYSKTRVTHHDYEIIGLIWEGMSNQEMAEYTGKSIRTIEGQRMELIKFLGLKNTIELMKYGLAHGIINPPKRIT